jgi:hypothetical protein
MIIQNCVSLNVHTLKKHTHKQCQCDAWRTVLSVNGLITLLTLVLIRVLQHHHIMVTCRNVWNHARLGFMQMTSQDFACRQFIATILSAECQPMGTRPYENAFQYVLSTIMLIRESIKSCVLWDVIRSCMAMTWQNFVSPNARSLTRLMVAIRQTSVFRFVHLENTPKIRRECACQNVGVSPLLITMWESVWEIAQLLRTFMVTQTIRNAFRHVHQHLIFMLTIPRDSV